MTNQNKLSADLSALLKVPAKGLNDLSSKACLCIGSMIHEARLSGEKAMSIDIGLGTLGVDLTSMQCKFVPGKELKACIKKAAEEGIDPLEEEVEAAFAEKLIAACEEAL